MGYGDIINSMEKYCGVHITHEAVQKIGGIGAVIAGLLTSSEYKNIFDKSLLYGPLFDLNGSETSKLGKDGIVYYSGKDNYSENNWDKIFKPIEEKYNIYIVYGKRKIVNETNPELVSDVDIVLLYINEMKEDILKEYKYKFWEKYKIESKKYDSWDYEQYFRIGIPYFEIINKLYSNDSTVHFSHEYMGIPSILNMKMNINYQKKSKNHISVYYAHEIPAVRRLVEKITGHDITFYNIMDNDKKNNISMEQEFNNFERNYRDDLVKKTDNFDSVFTVSKLVKQEYKYFNHGIEEKKLKIVYNGINHRTISFEKKIQSRNLLKKYCLNLFNYEADIIFSHVTRLVISKGLWRDIAFLEKMDKIFYEKGIKGFYILLSTLIGNGRNSSDIYKMEKEYGWPVLHKTGWPDLVGLEQDVYDSINIFNAKSKSIKAVFLNQFGFNRHSCGMRMPENLSWQGLREGADAELGFSIYEPFGIAQLETLPYGGISIISSACGCKDLLLEEIGLNSKLFHIIDFNDVKIDKNELINLNFKERENIEKNKIEENIDDIFNKLKNVLESEKYEKRFNDAQKLSQNLEWNHIVKKNIIPALF